jgi:hypothetical protein
MAVRYSPLLYASIELGVVDGGWEFAKIAVMYRKSSNFDTDFLTGKTHTFPLT